MRMICICWMRKRRWQSHIPCQSSIIVYWRKFLWSFSTSKSRAWNLSYLWLHHPPSHALCVPSSGFFHIACCVFGIIIHAPVCPCNVSLSVIHDFSLPKNPRSHLPLLDSGKHLSQHCVYPNTAAELSDAHCSSTKTGHDMAHSVWAMWWVLNSCSWAPQKERNQINMTAK